MEPQDQTQPTFNRKSLEKYLDQGLLFLWGIFFLFFPLVLSTATTENFVLPKQIFLTGVVLVSLLLLSAKTIISGKIFIRRTPFDIPLVLFAFALLLSSLFAVNRYDSLISFVPVLLSIVGYFVVVNVLKKEHAVVFAISAVVTSACAVALVAVFSFFKVYPLPLAFTHVQYFSTLGSMLEQITFLVAILPIALYFALPLLQGSTKSRTVAFAAATAIIAAGIGVTAFQLFTIQKPVILPFETGFQTAFAAISQDTGRVAQGFFFGNGFGNFASAFTRFKQASFNTNVNLWFIPFSQSSSFALELLTTTGILGFLSFSFLVFKALTNPTRKKSNPIFLSLIIMFVSSFVLPFSFIGISLSIMLLALYAGSEAIKHPSDFFDIEPRLVALKKGLIALHQTTEQPHERYEYNNVLPYIYSAILLLFIAVIGFYSGKFVLANADFQQSIAAAQSNNGTITYTKQVAALNMFPYQSSYFRIFSQTNIALANSIASAQPKGSSPSAQVQSTIYNLIQQGITTARTATSLAPESTVNWQNLASVYRALIGLGQNADTFTIQALQQAIILDPTNPQEFINLGGVYFQLGQYDNAIRAFQQAINLKQDYPNAYYNLAHAYLQKNDPQDALPALQIVKQLTVADKANYDKVVAEIDALQKNMPTDQTSNQIQQPASDQTQPPVVKPSSGPAQPLTVEGHSTPIPAQASPIPLASPTATPTPTK